MGIKNISKILKKYGKEVELKDFRDQKIAIDTSNYLYKFKYKTKDNDFLKKFMNQIYIFKNYNITPVYVFDSQPLLEKQDTLEKRKVIKNCAKEENKIHVTEKDISNLKELFDNLNVFYMDAVSEAEKTCSILNKNKKVNCVFSNDFDSLVFGCENLVTYTSSTGYVKYNLKEILDDIEITIENFIDVCISCGCDYYDKGVSNVGPVKAINNVKKYGKIENWPKVVIPSEFNLENIRTIFTSEEELPDTLVSEKHSSIENLTNFLDKLHITINPRTVKCVLP